jgi:hypothetical protein
VKFDGDWLERLKSAIFRPLDKLSAAAFFGEFPSNVDCAYILAPYAIFWR